MYKVISKVPIAWDSKKHGAPLIVLENEYGGQSVIGIDDHCLVLYNKRSGGEFQSVSHWYKEAIVAITKYIIDYPEYIDHWYTC